MTAQHSNINAARPQSIKGMGMKKALIGMVGAVAALGLAGTASANTTTVTYQGVITSGSDIEGYFGAAGADLTNDAVVASYTYDTSLGIEATDGASYDELDGGLDFGVTSPILAATLEINGKSYSYTPDYYADVSTGYGTFDWTTGAYDVTGVSDTAYALLGGSSSVAMQTDALPPLTSLSTPFSSTGFGLGYFDSNFADDGSSDTFSFQTSSVNVSAAPEPATWVLMFGGLGMIGGMLRIAKTRRREELCNGSAAV